MIGEVDVLMTDTLDQLRRVSLFAHLNREDLERIGNLMFERRYPKGRIVFVEGEPGEALYLLKEGKIKLTRQAEDGREHILHLVHAGEVFAEVVLFDGGGYPATAETMEDCQIGIIRNKDLEGIIADDPQLALAMLKIMARRLRAAQEKVMSLALHDAVRRVATTLLRLAEEHGVAEPEGLRLNLNLTNQDLANLAGTSRETVSRTLSDFRRRGIVRFSGQQVLILNRRRLLETF